MTRYPDHPVPPLVAHNAGKIISHPLAELMDFTVFFRCYGFVTHFSTEWDNWSVQYGTKSFPVHCPARFASRKTFHRTVPPFFGETVSHQSCGSSFFGFADSSLNDADCFMSDEEYLYHASNSNRHALKNSLELSAFILPDFCCGCTKKTTDILLFLWLLFFLLQIGL